jgi:lipoate-protein ligase A
MSPSSLTARDVSTSLEMTERLFAALDIYNDRTPRSAAMNMAIDEALLECAEVPSIRFYRWDHPALSFGYFGRFADVANYAARRDLVRRWTGGGIVLHEDDLTYSIVIPRTDVAFSESTMSIYENVHRALRDALGSNGAELATVAAVCDPRAQINSAVIDRRYNKDACFANPVPADVLLNGRKIAGAAQRRTRTGLLHQGSVQHVDLENGLAERFAKELSDDCSVKILGESLIERAHELAEEKYGSVSWLRRR